MPSYSVTYKNKTFSGEKVELDDKAFENCTFKDCMVIVDKGETRLSNCRIENCRLLLKGNAYTIGQIITLFTKGSPLKVAEFDETGSFFPAGEGG